MRVVRGREEALRTVLKRAAVEAAAVSSAVAQRIREVFGQDLTPAEVVERIVCDVRDRGDVAIRHWTERIDGVSLGSIEVSPEKLAEAEREVSPELLAALRFAAQRIEAFHNRQALNSWVAPFGDSLMGQLVRPLDHVGIYAPGGTAAYPSTVLMLAIPARVAGVGEVIVASPAGRDGQVNPSILAAASIAGAKRVFRIGGAQAIGALAYGTNSIPKVDKILGPGNIFVTLAKRLVFGTVAIDQLAGPTEVVIIADESADPVLLAADLLAQAEHDVLASPILITPCGMLVSEVQREVEEQLSGLDRQEIARQALTGQGSIVLVDSLDEAVELANTYAPEHVCLSVADPWAWLPKLRHAGGVFLGERSAEALGDYTAGPSHVMPTMGTARFSSPVSVADFVKITSIFALGPGDLESIAPAAETIARAEGFTAHAQAIAARRGKQT